MLAKLKQKLSSTDNKKITSNFLYLSAVQGANFLLPLITFPYLVRTLGIDMFGLLMFAQAFMVYFSMMADYGFNLSGTREISTHRNNLKRVEQIFSSIMLARLGLMLIGFVIMNIVVFSFEKFAANWLVYYLTYAMVIGSALFPVWFFQGMEKMKYITILSLVAKLFFTLSIFVIVDSPEDYLYVPLLNALGYISVGIISLWIIKKDFSVFIRPQRVKAVYIQLKRGWYIFISKISISMYTATNTFLLGVFTNDTTVGYYVIAEKVVRVSTFIFVPFNQAIYPHVIHLVKFSKEDAIVIVKKVLKYTIVIAAIIWSILYFNASLIFNLIFDDIAYETVDTFKMLSILILVIPIASILFNIAMLAFRLDNYFSKIYFLGAILNLLMISIFFIVIDSKIIGVSLSLIISEIVITIIAAVILSRKKILF